ncbi:MAG: 1-acyl-sn-glycerol-3-phosphate acyltransferase, partial [Thermoleophilia bacterium]|nr:1-acyl-sn-glycerol-3-phosphate acyltransferase [Thermoleophilia bacterium]
FYVDRGLGRGDTALTTKIYELVNEQKTLEFFVEGGRSRSRHFLKPKRGFLRALQASGANIVLLPVAISYDRVPGEFSFRRELAGGGKSVMRLSGLSIWITKLLAKRVRLGRIHLAAGLPVALSPISDVDEVGRTVVGQLQQATVISTVHLRAFLASNPALDMTVPALTDALRARGAHVLESKLGAEDVSSPCVRASLCRQLEAVIYPEARASRGEHPVVANHLAQHDFLQAEPTPEALADPRSPALVRAVFEPVCHDYLRVVTAIADPERWPATDTPRTFVQRVPECQLPNVEAAFAELTRRGVLEQSGSAWKLGRQVGGIEQYRELYAWIEPAAQPEAVADPARAR